jgi:hypothetical protein
MPADEPEMPAEAEIPATGGNEQCVPIESLAMPDEGEQMTNPEVGDPVSYTVEGKVTRVEGGKAYVAPESINGKPIEAEKPAEEGGTGEDAAMQQLQDEAGKTGFMG